MKRKKKKQFLTPRCKIAVKNNYSAPKNNYKSYQSLEVLLKKKYLLVFSLLSEEKNNYSAQKCTACFYYGDHQKQLLNKMGKLKDYIQKFKTLEVVWKSLKVKQLKQLQCKKCRAFLFFAMDANGGCQRPLQKKSFNKKKCSVTSRH